MVLLWLGIDPRTARDQEQLGAALQQLMANDPTLAIKTSADGMAMIGASGEDQLDAAVDQLVHRFGVEAAVSKIEVAYKETLTRTAEGESKYAVQSGGRSQYAHVRIRVGPRESGSGCVFENAIVGGAIPTPMIAAVEEGIDEVLDRGILVGYPIDDVCVTVYDGSYHDVDSSEAAFRIAGRLAFLDAARRAKPILLEPIMRVSVVMPPQYERRVIDGLRRRAAGFQLFTEEVVGAWTMTISTLVPLSQMFGYRLDLSASTHREGTLTMAFSHYAPAILSEDDGDRAADVTAPLRPRTPTLILRAAVPEPRD